MSLVGVIIVHRNMYVLSTRYNLYYNVQLIHKEAEMMTQMQKVGRSV